MLLGSYKIILSDQPFFLIKTVQLLTAESTNPQPAIHPRVFPEGEPIKPEITESVDELRERLNRMKKIMAERKTTNDPRPLPRKDESSVIDGNFLSFVFGFTLVLIVSVSGYAFYNLFVAIMKRHGQYHEEL